MYPHTPSVQGAIAAIAKLDAPDNENRRVSDKWFGAMPAVKNVLELEASNHGVDHTQVFANLLVAVNGCCARMVAKMQPKDEGYPNTCAVGNNASRKCL